MPDVAQCKFQQSRVDQNSLTENCVGQKYAVKLKFKSHPESTTNK